MRELQDSGHRNVLEQESDDVWSITTEPKVKGVMPIACTAP